MSIAVTGPEGYEFQYLLSIYLSLQFVAFQGAEEIVIEQANAEDITIMVKESGCLKRVDVQIKSQKKQLSATEFAEWLCHFENRSKNNNLLSRVLDKKVSKAIFIAKSRVMDEVNDLNLQCDKYNFKKTALVKPKRKAVTKLVEAIGQSFSKSKKKIDLERNKACLAQKARLKGDKQLLELVLDACYLVHELTEREAVSYIKMLLKDEFKINESKIVPLIGELTKIVIEGRASRAGIYQQFINTIDAARIPLPQLPTSYIEQNQEAELLKELGKNCILFLTGISFCGKTITAQSIVEKQMKKQALIYEHTESVDEASNFMKYSIDEDGICLLEDPFGHTYSANSVEQEKKFTNLLQNIPKHCSRYLVVTSNKQMLESLKMDSSKWHDLTTTDRDFIRKIWLKLCSEVTIPSNVSDIVNDCIDTDEESHLFQPGHLNNIRNNYKKLKNISKSSVREIAFADAKKISAEIEMKGAEAVSVFQCMAISMNTVNGIPLHEISYMNEADEAYLPGLIDNNESSLGTSIFGDQEEPDHFYFPKHDREFSSSDQLVGEFEERDWIKCVNGKYIFSHPVFFEAAKMLLSVNSEIKFKLVTRKLIKGLFSLDYNVGINSAIAIERLLDNSTGERSKLLLEILDRGMNDMYPSVQSLCFEVLCKHLDVLRTEVQERVYQKIRNGYDYFMGSRYMWNDGIPFLPNKRVMNLARGLFDTLKPSQMEEIKEQLGKGQNVTPEQAWKLVDYYSSASKYKKQRIMLDLSLLRKLLAYPEQFIRANVSFLLAASFQDGDISFIRSQFNDTNPITQFETIKGTWAAWPYFKDLSIKTEVLSLIKTSFDNKQVIIRSIGLITEFDTGYSSFSFDWRHDIEEKAIDDMWQVWAEVVPLFFKQLPATARYNTGRFQGTMNTAAQKLTASQNHSIFVAWFNWLTPIITPSNFLYEQGLHFLDYFDAIFKQMPTVDRYLVIKRLSELDNLLFKADLLRRLLYNWSELCNEEKEFLSDYIRTCSSILKSVVLTGSRLPEPICSMLIGMDCIDPSSPEIEERVGNDIFRKCFGITMLENSFRDIGNFASGIWYEMLFVYLDRPLSDLYPLAVIQLTEVVLGNCYTLAPFPMEEAEEKLINLISGSGPTTRKLVFDKLCEWVICHNHCDTKGLLTAVLQYSLDDEKVSYITSLHENLESITYIGNHDQLPVINFTDSDSIFFEGDLRLLVEAKFLNLLPEAMVQEKLVVCLDILETYSVRSWNIIKAIQSHVHKHRDILDERFDAVFDTFTKKVLKQQAAIQNLNICKFTSMLDEKYLYKY